MGSAALQAGSSLVAAATVTGGANLPGDLTVTGTTTTVSSLTANTNGVTYENYLITGGVTINADNVTLRNCRVQCIGINDYGVAITPGATGTLLDGVEIGGGSNGTTNTGTGVGLLFGDAGSGAVTNVADGVWAHHCIDGIRADGRCRFQWGRVSSMDTSGYAAVGGDHGDGSQSTGWGDIEFLNSEIDGGNNDALFFNQEGGNPAIGRVLVDNCRLVGKSGTQSGTPSTWQSTACLHITGGGPITVTNTALDGPCNDPATPGYSWAAWTNNTRDGSPLSAP